MSYDCSLYTQSKIDRRSFHLIWSKSERDSFDMLEAMYVCLVAICYKTFLLIMFVVLVSMAIL
jgi:hypothetical protein